MAQQECCKSEYAALVHKNMLVCEPVRATARKCLIQTLIFHILEVQEDVVHHRRADGPVAAVTRATAGKW